MGGSTCVDVDVEILVSGGKGGEKVLEICGIGLGGGLVSDGIVDDTVILCLFAFILH